MRFKATSLSFAVRVSSIVTSVMPRTRKPKRRSSVKTHGDADPRPNDRGVGDDGGDGDDGDAGYVSRVSRIVGVLSRPYVSCGSMVKEHAAACAIANLVSDDFSCVGPGWTPILFDRTTYESEVIFIHPTFKSLGMNNTFEERFAERALMALETIGDHAFQDSESLGVSAAEKRGKPVEAGVSVRLLATFFDVNLVTFYVRDAAWVWILRWCARNERSVDSVFVKLYRAATRSPPRFQDGGVGGDGDDNGDDDGPATDEQSYVLVSRDFGWTELLHHTPKCSCEVCGNETTMRCLKPGCEVRYCSRECQKLDWKSHKPICGTGDVMDNAEFVAFVKSAMQHPHSTSARVVKSDAVCMVVGSGSKSE